MKALILIFFSLISSLAKCQLTIETYNLSDSLLSTEVSSDTLIWTRSGMNTETFSDDNITMMARNNKGQNLYKSDFIVQSSKIEEGKLIYTLIPSNGISDEIWFWLDEKKGIPMVVHEKVNSYVVYYGNVMY